MSQLHGGGSSLRLLSGRWSSHNSVFTFAGHPTNDQVYKYRPVLTSPFGTGAGAKLIPQDGFTKVLLHGVLVQRETDRSVADSHTLLQKLVRNPVCHDLLIINQPPWFIQNRPANKFLSTVTFAFFDTDGSRLQQIIRQPPSIFGAAITAKQYVSLPLVCQCSRCHMLNHSDSHCPKKKGYDTVKEEYSGPLLHSSTFSQAAKIQP
jgi:hypothetical protein